MKPLRRRASVGAFVLLCAWPPGGTPAQVPSKVSPVVVTNVWIREAAVSQPATAAYATIENPTDVPLTLVAAEVEGAGVVELHEMKMSGDMMAMVKVASIVVPARGTVELKPGGLHLMLFQRTRAFEPGGTAAITFRFADGTVAAARAEIRKKMATGE